MSVRNARAGSANRPQPSVAVSHRAVRARPAASGWVGRTDTRVKRTQVDASWMSCYRAPPEGGGLKFDVYPRLPGWVTDNHEETHYVLPAITSHLSWESGGVWAGGLPVGPCGKDRYLSTVKMVVNNVPDVRSDR